MAMADAASGFLSAVFGGRGKLGKEAAAEAPWTPNGGFPPSTPEVLKRVRASIEDRLPKGMAVLVVYRARDAYRTDGGESFGLLGAYGDNLAEPLGGAGKPGLDLNSLAVQLEETLSILGQLASWSREKEKLVSWLNRLMDGANQHPELELVIWDVTGFRIPWELFWLRDPLKRRAPSFLGALMTVTRWLDIAPSSIVQDFTRQDFTRNPGQTSAPVAAYVYETESDKDMARDKELLRDFQVEYADSMSDLLTLLSDPNGAALAMVYAACHGEFGDGPGQSKLHKLTYESAHQQADEYGFGRLHNRQTLVFLNACASGPVGEDRGRYNDGSLRGFPKMFLECGAAGVLATAAPITNDFAHKAASDLFNELRRDPALPVARAVRDLRR